jgi:hypothetical protein
LVALAAAGGVTGAMALASSATAASDRAAVHHSAAGASISGHVDGAPAGTGVGLSTGESGTGGPVRTNGSYTVTDVSPGTYTLSVILPKGYHVTSATPGKGAAGGTKVDGVAHHDEIIDIKITNGSKGVDYDFTVKR